MTASALEGMAALIPGGAGGIGGACARALAADGAAVTLMGRTALALERAVTSLREEIGRGASVQHVVGDGTQADDVERAVEVACGLTGRLDICVPTVGGGTIAPLVLLD